MCWFYCRVSSYSIPSLFILLRKLFTTSLSCPTQKIADAVAPFAVRRLYYAVLFVVKICVDPGGENFIGRCRCMHTYKLKKGKPAKSRLVLHSGILHTQGKKKKKRARLFLLLLLPSGASPSHKNEGIVGFYSTFHPSFPTCDRIIRPDGDGRVGEGDGPVPRMFATRCLAADGTNSASF